MSKAEKAAKGLLQGGEEGSVRTFAGLSTGLNQTSRNPLDGVVLVTGSAMVVGWEKLGVVNKGMAERFEAGELLRVDVGNEPVGGALGALQSRVGKDTWPTVSIQTSKGSYSLHFKPRGGNEAEAAYAAIAGLAGRR